MITSIYKNEDFFFPHFGCCRARSPSLLCRLLSSRKASLLIQIQNGRNWTKTLEGEWKNSIRINHNYTELLEGKSENVSGEGETELTRQD